MAQLLKQYKLPGIFFIPNNCELAVEEIRYLAKDFEVGGHTVNHPEDMKKLSLADQSYEINFNRGWLQGITGQEIEWFCYPSGRYNEKTIEIVRRAGFKYARTTIVGATSESPNPFRTNSSVHVYPSREEYKGMPWLDFAKKMLFESASTGGIFHLWGHSWEVEKFHLWDELEELFKFISQYANQDKRD